MRTLLVACLLGVALGGDVSQVSIQMPYQNPAGVTYTSVQPYAVSTGAVQYSGQYVASNPVLPAQPLLRQYPAQPLLRQAYTHIVPQAYTPLATQAVPQAYHAAYTAPLLRQAVHHVPAYTDVPVAKYHDQPTVIQKVVDVAKPQVATRRFQLRRPAIQKEFYDVEERIVVRPAGKAVIELDHPVSKSAAGPAIHYPAHAFPVGIAAHPVALPVPAQSQQQQIVQQQPQQQQEFQQQPQEQQPQQQQPQQPPQQAEPEVDYSDSIALDNPEIARARTLPGESSQEMKQGAQGVSDQAATSRSAAPAEPQSPPAEQQPSAAPRSGVVASLRSGEVPSPRSLTLQESEINQARLFDLLTSRGTLELSDSANVRARLISTVTGRSGEVPKEQVSTRRIVVNRPIQTVQEIDVVQPYTKLERVAVHQPAVVRTPTIGLARVATPYSVLSYAHH